MDILINYLDKFGPELLVIQFGFLVILSTLFLWLWFSNRRKYHNLKHVIPANVVKNYLDSIIQNSTALKSSLFRGGGLDLDNVPSVMPLGQLGGGENVAVSGAPSAKVLEELAEKKALIASLEAQLQSAKSAGAEFETKAKNNHKDLTIALEKIAELESRLENTGSATEVSHDDSALKEELAAVTKERDELLERLKEFEVIADDLANLKRLQQENEQLKKSLGAKTEGDAPREEALQAEVSELLEQVSEAVAETSSHDSSSLDEFLSEGEMTPEEKEMLAAMNEAAAEASEETEKKEEKPLANDDLLSEFEKMLG